MAEKIKHNQKMTQNLSEMKLSKLNSSKLIAPDTT